MVLGAAIIRFWNFGSLGYQHWDEYFFISGADVVSRHLRKGFESVDSVIAPLVSLTDGTLFHVFGVNGWIPLAVSATYGTLSAVALYFLGSRLFGNAVGLIAAAILATAEYSVMYSRMALAEATFLFWLIMSVLFVWLGFTRRRFGYWVLAGVSSGLLLNTKYDGAFPLVLAASWLVVEFVVDRVRGRSGLLSNAWSEYAPRVVGVAGMVAIALLLFTPWILKLAGNPGFHVFFAQHAGFFLTKTPPIFVAWYFWLFASPPTVVLAVAGIAVAVVRFTRADRLLLIYTAGWVIAIFMFDPYPREALSLLPAVAIWAARAIVELWKLVRTWRPRVPLAATAASAVCAAAILVGQLLPLPQMLSLRTRGYADAGVIAAQYQSTGSTIVVQAQDVAYLYLKGTYRLRATPSMVQLLTEKGSTIVFMTDQTMLDFHLQAIFFDLNLDRLKVIDRVPNPLYDDVFLQPATYYGLSHLDDPPDSYRYITFWRVTGPLLFPPSWGL